MLGLLTPFCQEWAVPPAPRRSSVRHPRVRRSASRPVTAASLAGELEVWVRTIYRDITTLQARRIPIEGAAGIGYVAMRFRPTALDVHRGRGGSDCGRGQDAGAHRRSRPAKSRERPVEADASGSRNRAYLARNRWFESSSLQQTVRLSREVARGGRELRLFARVCRPWEVVRSAETGIGRRHGGYRRQCLCCANFQYRSAGDVGSGGRSSCRAKLVLAQAKPSTVRCSCQVSGRRECASSLSAVRSRGWRPSRTAWMMSGAR